MASGTGPESDEAALPEPRPVDPRAIRVGVAPTSLLPDDPVVTVAPPAEPLQLFEPELGEIGVLGGVVGGVGEGTGGPQPHDGVLLNGEPAFATLEWIDAERAILVRATPDGTDRVPVLFGPARVNADGTTSREVVVDGWRIDLVLESERRAALRDRSRRGGSAGGRSGPLEVRAIIPGRIVAVSVTAGEAVTAGQQLLVLEAMKMQNELRAPREGTIEKVAVAVGTTVEVGDVLMVIG